MSERQEKLLPQTLKDLLADKSQLLSQAQVFEEMGMAATAQPLWLSAASSEERLAPLLESLGHTAEAARPNTDSTLLHKRRYVAPRTDVDASLAVPLSHIVVMLMACRHNFV